MHEVSLGGTLLDYLTREPRPRATYEDLRQALARYLVEELGYAPNLLRPRHAVGYAAGGEQHERAVDVALFTLSGVPRLFAVFCPGQVHTYAREVTALARLALPVPCPLAVVTDMREAELFAVRGGEILASGLAALPRPAELARLAEEHPHPPLSPEQRDREGRILHTYTGFLKNCCGEACSLS